MNAVSERTWTAVLAGLDSWTFAAPAAVQMRISQPRAPCKSPNAQKVEPSVENAQDASEHLQIVSYALLLLIMSQS